MRCVIAIVSLIGMLVPLADAAEPGTGPHTTPPHGEFAAAIRSAELPCAHVIQVEQIADDLWRVECNAGNYRVARNSNSQLSATQSD